MFCSKCGAQNEETAINCIQCGNPLRPPAYGTPPPVPPQAYQQSPMAQSYAQVPPPAQTIPNYLVQAILVTFFCCLPLGIVSIIFAAQVNTKAAAGDIQGALAASKQAKTFAWIAFGIGIAGIVIYGIIMVLGLAASMARHAH